MTQEGSEMSAPIPGSAFPDLPTPAEIEEALETLTRRIGAYGVRISQPFSITWGNGITAGINGRFEAGGTPNVARRICHLEGDDRRVLRHGNHGYTLNANGQPLCDCGAATNGAYRDVPNLPCWRCGKPLARES